MILVTIGTSEPFDRLLRAVARLGTEEAVVVQRGSSTFCPPGATCVDFWPYETLVEHIQQSRVVLTHAGVGSILVAITNGKRPVVVPRLSRFGEAVDDHQLELGRRLHETGLLTLVEDVDDLPRAVAADSGIYEPAVDQHNALANELRAYVSARAHEATSYPA